MIFDRAVCLNVDKRPGARDRVRSEFAPHGIDVACFLAGDGKTAPGPYDHIDVVPPPRSGYPAWATRPNSYNAFLCFRKIVARARDAGIGTLLLLEDDVTLLPEFGHVLAAAWAQLHRHDPDWHMLYLGANHTFSPTAEVAPNLLRLCGSGCFHAVVLRDSVFADVLSLPLEGPIDGVCGRRLHPVRGCYAVWPNVAVTLPGYSHCEGHDVDYTNYFLAKGC